MVDGISQGAIEDYTFYGVYADATISATFKPLAYEIYADTDGGGTIDPSGTVYVLFGENQTFTITPNPGFMLYDVSVDGNYVGPVTEYTFTNVSDGHSIYAEFLQLQYEIVPTAGPGGYIDPSSTQYHYFGGSRTFTIHPDPGYRILDVLVDGVSVGAVTEYTFSNISDNHTIDVTFEQIQITITASATGSGTIYPSGSVSVPFGDNIQFDFTPDLYHEIKAILVNGNPVAVASSYTFYDVTTSHTIEVQFGLVNYTIAASAGQGGSISPSGNVIVPHGGDQLFTITPDPGYRIEEVMVHGFPAGPISSYTFNSVSQDFTIHATFSRIQYTISANADANGSISPSGNVLVSHGENQSFTITPDQGYAVLEVYVDGNSVGDVTSYTFNNVLGDHDIWAIFMPSAVTTVEVTVSTTPFSLQFTVDNVSYLGSQTFQWVPGSSHTIATTSPQVIDAGTRAVFVNWSDGGDLSHSITTPSQNTTYTATFKTQYLLQTVAETGGTISPPTGYHDPGDIEISATANSGYMFAGFSGDLTGTTTPQTLNLTGPAIVVASFTPFNSFTFLDAGISMVQEGMSVWGDYDNDGYLDILVTGLDAQSTKISKVFRNHGNGTFSDIGANLVGVNASSAAWGDYDNDGYLDLIIVGRETGETPSSRIYRNNNGVFQDINAGLAGVHNGTAAWGDYNNDGFPDLLLSGYSALGPTTKLYKNNKNGTFSEVVSGLPDLGVSSVAWGDFDNDGDLDVLITGFEGLNIVSRVYRNTGGMFTDIQAGLTPGYGRSVAWGDYNNDGYLDILMTGGTFTKVYRNTGPGLGFTFEDINASLTGVSSGSVAWGDYDNDGDLDILLTGFAGDPVTLLYKNNAGTFEEINAGLFGSGDGHVAWGDFDNDGDLDILRAGLLFVNSSFGVNTLPAAPSNLTAEPVGNNRVALAWSAASDGQTPVNGLSYNLRVGTSPGASNILGPMANTANGFRRIPARGPQQTLRDTLDLPPGTYYWSVQAIDGALAGGPFASEGSFTIAPTFTNVVNLPGLYEGTAVWGDYDGDGDLDYVVTGWSGINSNHTRVYRNDGNNVFTLINANMAGVWGGAAAWGDYDNDGDLDLVVMGYSQGQLITKLYRNDGNDTFSEVNAGLSGGGSGSVVWGDVDGDGDLDLLMMGNRFQNRVTDLYRNDGNDTFTLISTGLPPLMAGTVVWGDYDNDGDLDLLVVGTPYSMGTAISRVYRNDGITQNTLQLTDINAGLTPVIYGAAAWGDYDNDGYLDIALTGSISDGLDISIARVYRNNGDGTFTNIHADLTPVRSGSIAWGDFDNDGDLDILLNGGTTSGFPGNPVTRVFENRNGTFHNIEAGLPGVQNGIAVWGDYDNDGNLDILIGGGPGTGGINYNAIYRNNTTTPNTVPTAPTGLTATPLSGNRIALAWNAASDGQTPVNGLSYNIRVGTTPGGVDVASPMAKVGGPISNLGQQDGYRRIPARGPQQILRDTLTLPTGQYYWSVQAIDGALAGGPFASEGTVNVGATSTVDITVTTVPSGLGIRVDDVDYTSPQTFQWVPNSSHTIATTSPQSLVAGTQYVFVDWSDGGALSHSITTPSGNTTYTATFKTQHELTTSAGTGGTISPASGFYDEGDVQISATANSDYMFAGFSGALTGTTTPQTLNLAGPANVDASFAQLPFTDINAGLTGVDRGSVAWGDYDNDGDLDILLTGNASTGPLVKLYRNDGGAFNEVSAGLVVVNHSSVAWGDYDNDGDLDILLSGHDGVSSSISKVYRNDNGVFTDINAGLMGMSEGSVAWGDYENDGDLDILLSGYSGNSISKIYRNDNGVFTDISAALTGTSRGSVAWGDYDNDGDLDILLSGRNPQGISISIVYRNDYGIFTDINAGLTGVWGSSVAWGDYDNDADLDILLSGLDGQNNRISKVYRNDNGTFTDINAGLTGVGNSSVAWGDYDNDGDLDILLTGHDSNFRVSKLYRNDGGNFNEVNAGLMGMSEGSVAWGDYDNDGKLDILLTGSSVAGRISRIYRSNAATANTIPTAPAGLTATPLSGNRIALAWNAASDGQTPAAGLSYNIRVGTTPGGVNVASPMAKVGGPITNPGQLDGWRRIPARGPQQILRDTLTLPPGQYYWSVQAIDGAFAGGPFATEGSFNTAPFTDINAGLTGVSQGSAVWGDYDNDGDLDVVLTGLGVTKIFRNDGGGTFTDINAALPGLYLSCVAWGDYDNDGDLDLLIAGSTLQTRISSIYRNNGDGTFTDINAGLTGVSEGSATWGDYDNDGDLDILLSGYLGGGFWLREIYRNDGNGVFVNINLGLMFTIDGSIAWADYDNDGDLDVLLTGDDGSLSNAVARLYRNDNGIFTEINAGLTGVSFGSSIVWGDYDNDGKLDLLLMGYTIPFSNPVSNIYRNNGDGTFTNINAGLPGLAFGSAAWGDYDNDGDLDILLSGSSISRIYRNNGNGTFTDINAGLPGVSQSSVAWGDYDNDGKLDILLAGAHFSGNYSITSVYRNNGTTANTVPTAPTGLTATALSGNRIALAWNAASDNQTPANGLSYNIRVGTTPGGVNVASPMAKVGGAFTNPGQQDGWRRIPKTGPKQILRDTLKVSGPGPFYWSVQAIDGALAGGPFAAEQVITPDPSGIQSDDFNTPALKPFWTFINPGNPSALSLIGTGTPDALLRIAVPAGASHDIWTAGNMAPRIMQNANNVDFEVEVKFQGQMTGQYQMQGIIVEESPARFVRFDFVKGNTNTRIFAASFNGTTPTVLRDFTIPQGNPAWMRLKREGNTFIQSYSYDGVNWTVLNPFTNVVLNVTKIGPFVGNAGYPEGTAPAFTGLVDYFFSTATPIVPEDGITSPPNITQHPQNVSVSVGQTATFTVVATGTTPLSYKWQKSNVDIPGATSSSYTTPPTTGSDNNTEFRCIVSNTYGTVTSTAAILSVTQQVVEGLLVKYDFNENVGLTVNDVSGTGTPLNLTIPDASLVNWIPGALQVTSPTLIQSATAATKVQTGVQATNEITVEAWLTPQNTTQKGPARIVTISGDAGNRNVTLGQGLWDAMPSALYNARLRTSATNSNGQPELSTADGSLTTALTHVVYTRNAAGNAKLYLNGVEAAAMNVTGNFANWNTAYKLGIANEFGASRPWLGTFHMVAIYNRALTAAQVALNHSAGPEGAPTPTPPQIVQEPQNRTATVGSTAAFSVTATGTLPLGYQWQKNNQDIPGATSANYTTPPVTMGDNGATFRCIVSNAHGTVTSNAATLTVVDQPSGLLVRYDFNEGAGQTVNDVSGVGTPLNLSIPAGAPVTWGTGTLSVTGATLLQSAAAATKVITAVSTSNEITIEAWVTPQNATQNGPARIVTISADPGNRNVTLGQGMWGTMPSVLYNARLRTASTNSNGQPELATPNGSLTTSLTHVVYTRTSAGVAKLYLNGVESATMNVTGDLANWNAAYKLGLANEFGLGRAWLGTFHRVMIFSRALSAGEIATLHTNGPESGGVTRPFGGDLAGMNPADQPAMRLIPTEYSLDGNYPNPFNPTTTIRYGLPVETELTLVIYDVMGQEVRRLIDGRLAEGYHQVLWDGRDNNGSPVSSGVYIYRLQSEKFTKAQRMVLMK